MALPSIVRLPLTLTTNVVTGVAKLALRPLQRGGEAPRPATVPPSGEAPRPAPAPPSREPQAERTVGRRSHERKEPSPEPAQGTSAAEAGSRRASTPKTARSVRKRSTAASNLDTVASGPGRGRGGTPEAPAENTPKARAKAREGREPAPMGSQDDAAEESRS